MGYKIAQKIPIVIPKEVVEKQPQDQQEITISASSIKERLCQTALKWVFYLALIAFMVKYSLDNKLYEVVG